MLRGRLQLAMLKTWLLWSGAMHIELFLSSHIRTYYAQRKLDALPKMRSDAVKSFLVLGWTERETYSDGCAPHTSCYTYLLAEYVRVG